MKRYEFWMSFYNKIAYHILENFSGEWLLNITVVVSIVFRKRYSWKCNQNSVKIWILLLCKINVPSIFHIVDFCLTRKYLNFFYWILLFKTVIAMDRISSDIVKILNIYYFMRLEYMCEVSKSLTIQNPKE